MLRSRISSALDRVGVLSGMLALRARTPSPWLPILTYHRVAEPKDAAMLDDGVVDVTPAMFDRHMASLTKWFSVLDLDQVLAFRAGAPLPKNPVLVTFDDGYRDNYEVALPILKKYGVKATFFVATHYIEERRLFWWDRINFLLKTTKLPRVEIAYPARETLHLDSPEATHRSVTRALRIVKDHYALDLERFLGGLAEATGVTLARDDERRMVDDLMMTWDEVRNLRAAGMDVQSHTSTHRVLQTLPPEKYAEELGGSKEVLEGVLKERVRTISYPVGKPLEYTPEIRRAVRAAGYELGFSNATGVNGRWSFDPLDAKRIAVDVDLPDSQFLAMLALPYLAY